MRGAVAASRTVRLAQLMVCAVPNGRGCLIYPCARPDRRYPVVQWRGQRMGAARLVWTLTHGRGIPSGLLACHTCDTPACVNVDHIFLGTQSENMLDASAKGRWRGRRSGVGKWRKLSPESVRQIRALYAAGGQSQVKLGRRFGVNSRYVGRILTGEKRRAVA